MFSSIGVRSFGAGDGMLERRPWGRGELVAWVAGLGAVTAESVASAEGISLASARGRLGHCVRAGLLKRNEILTNRPALYVTTMKGSRAFGLSTVRPCEARAGNAEHLIACSGVAATFARACSDYEVMGERSLRALEGAKRERVASALLSYDGDGTAFWHCPDLVLWRRGGVGLPVAVEVELTLKGGKRLAEICKAWARNDLVSGVIYVTSGKADAGVRAAVARANAERKIAVVGLDSMKAERSIR